MSSLMRSRWANEPFVLDLHGAFIPRVNLSGANLVQANFEGTDATEVNFRGADFAGANLNGTILIGADLSGARNLTADQLSRAILDESTRLPDYIDRSQIKAPPID